MFPLAEMDNRGVIKTNTAENYVCKLKEPVDY
jgi:hypothetical protein